VLHFSQPNLSIAKLATKINARGDPNRSSRLTEPDMAGVIQVLCRDRFLNSRRSCTHF
jgi:hypothetical protein